jgi:hypothetical protein
MGPDLFGIVWAAGFLAAVIGAFALVDRLLTGAWDALRGSPGMGLVAGMAAWRDGVEHPDLSSSPSSADAAPPSPSADDDPPASPGLVPTEHVQGPGLLPWRSSRTIQFAA